VTKKPANVEIPLSRRVIFDAARWLLKDARFVDLLKGKQFFSIVFYYLSRFLQERDSASRFLYLLGILAACIEWVLLNTEISLLEIESFLHSECERQERTENGELLLAQKIEGFGAAMLVNLLCKESKKEVTKEAIQVAVICCQIIESHSKEKEEAR
jgi:hypothetical protein